METHIFVKRNNSLAGSVYARGLYLRTGDGG